MDEPGEDMDNPVGLERTSIELRTNTPAGTHGSIFHARLAAGHARLPEDDPPTSWSHPGHGLELGVKGRRPFQ